MLAEINPASLGSIRYLSCFPKSVYEGNERTEEQKVNKQGIPLWGVAVEVYQPGAFRPDSMRLEVASKKNPCDGIEPGQAITIDSVKLRWFVFSNDNNRIVQTFIADGIQAVGA